MSTAAVDIPSYYQNPDHFPALNGIRGVAILLVLVAHHFSFLGGVDILGMLGVDLFFVLSGFLITHILIKTRNEPGFLKTFLKRRALRILPLYYLALLLYFLVTPLFEKLSVNYSYYVDQWPFLVFHLNNLAQIIYPKPGPPLLLNHFWSLSLEEQFYLIWPFIVLIISSLKRLLTVLIVLVLLVMVARFLLWHQLQSGYFYWHLSTNIRFDCLGAGCILAVLYNYRITHFLKSYRILLGIVASVTFILIWVKFLFATSLPYYTIAGITFYAFICGMMIGKSILPGKLQAWLSSPLLSFLGKISYGLYVWHFPIVMAMNLYFLPWFQKVSSMNTFLCQSISGFLGIAIAMLVSYISWKYFESPIREMGRLKYRISATN